MISVPSNNKGKHACQRVFSALFALFALACASKPASQKAKITRKYIAARCGQFCRSRNVSRQGKTRREYCRIVKGLDAVWAHFCPSKPCLPLLIDGTIDQQVCPCQSMVQGGRSRPSARNVSHWSSCLMRYASVGSAPASSTSARWKPPWCSMAGSWSTADVRSAGSASVTVVPAPSLLSSSI